MAAVVALAAGRTIRCRTEASVAAAGSRWHWPAGPVPLSTAEVELAATEDRAPPPIAVYSARLAEIEKKNQTNQSMTIFLDDPARNRPAVASGSGWRSAAAAVRRSASASGPPGSAGSSAAACHRRAPG